MTSCFLPSPHWISSGPTLLSVPCEVCCVGANPLGPGLPVTGGWGHDVSWSCPLYAHTQLCQCTYEADSSPSQVPEDSHALQPQSRKSTAHILVQTPQQQHMGSCHCGHRCFIGKGMRRFPLFKRMGTVLATLTVGCAGSLARPRSKWEDTCQSVMGVPHRPGCRPRNHTDSWGRTPEHSS